MSFPGQRARVSINPRGWLGKRPMLTVLVGNLPVLDAFVSEDGTLQAWRTNWGLHGPDCSHDVTPAEIAEIIGWRMPAESKQVAA